MCTHGPTSASPARFIINSLLALMIALCWAEAAAIPGKVEPKQPTPHPSPVKVSKVPPTRSTPPSRPPPPRRHPSPPPRPTPLAHHKHSPPTPPWRVAAAPRQANLPGIGSSSSSPNSCTPGDAICFCTSAGASTGMFADPTTGCQKYYWCAGPGQYSYHTCPTGLLFSDAGQACDWAGE